MSGHAFIDESKRGPYLLCLYAANAPDRTAVRRALRGLLSGGEQSLHMKDESDSRRRAILATLTEPGHRLDVLVADQAALRSRRRILTAGVWPQIRDRRIQRLVLESGAEQDERDRKTLYQLTRTSTLGHEFSYLHAAPESEALLWVPDAVAWAYGKGRQWRRRTASLVVDEIDVDQL